MEKIPRNIYQRPRRTKEQIEMNKTLEGICSRVTEAEEQIVTWKVEWLKSQLSLLFYSYFCSYSVLEKEYRGKKEEDSLRDL